MNILVNNQGKKYYFIRLKFGNIGYLFRSEDYFLPLVKFDK